MANVAKLHLYIVLKNEILLKVVNYLRNAVHANKKGFMNDDLMVDWFHLLWSTPGHSSVLFKPKNAFVLGSFCGHITWKVKKELHTVGTDIVLMSDVCQLQPLVGINRPPKCHMQHMHNKWLARKGRQLTSTWHLKQTSVLDVCEWAAVA